MARQAVAAPAPEGAITNAAPTKAKRTLSPSARKKIAAAQKKRWAARNAGQQINGQEQTQPQAKAGRRTARTTRTNGEQPVSSIEALFAMSDAEIETRLKGARKQVKLYESLLSESEPEQRTMSAGSGDQVFNR